MTQLSDIPHELLKLIAAALPTPADVTRFSRTCKRLHAAVHSDQVVFRALFLRTYEPPRCGGKGYDFARAVKERLGVLRGSLVEERVLMEMVMDSNTVNNTSLNLRQLSQLPGLSPEPSLLLYPLRLLPQETEREVEVAMLQNRIHTVAALEVFTDPRQQSKEEVLRRCLDIAKLFSHHIDRRWQLAFYHASLLEREDVPMLWEGRLEDGDERKEVPRRWFGAYTYLVDPRGVGEEPFVMMEETGERHMMELHLSFVYEKEEKFVGYGKDYTRFRMREGVLAPLWERGGEGQVRGWKRVRFLKDYSTHSWCYEGIMLPGNNIMMGMWRDPSDAQLGTSWFGMFMLWAVSEGRPELGSRNNRLVVV